MSSAYPKNELTKEPGAQVDQEQATPPSFEELPAWFQDEINLNNERRSVERDTQKSLGVSSYRRFAIAGALLNLSLLAVLGVVFGFGSFWQALLLALSGSLCGVLCVKLDPSEPTGAILSTVCNLPIVFLVSAVSGQSAFGMLAFFIACLMMVCNGILLAMMVRSVRLEELPF